MATQHRLPHVQADNPAHYLALLGLLSMNRDDLRLHFDGLTPVVTSVAGRSAEDIGEATAVSVHRATDLAMAGHPLNKERVGELTLGSPLGTYAHIVDSQWSEPEALDWSRIVDHGSADTESPAKHFLYFGAGATNIRTSLAKFWDGAQWKASGLGLDGTDQITAFFSREITGLLRGEAPAMLPRDSPLWFSGTGLDTRARYGSDSGFTEIAIEALAGCAIPRISPVSRKRAADFIFRWSLNPSPSTSRSIEAMQRLDRSPAGLATFEANIHKVNKYMRFGKTTVLQQGARK